MKKISNTMVNNKRFRAIAERFIAFAIIQPSATKVEIKQRANIVNAIAGLFHKVVLLIFKNKKFRMKYF